MAAGDKIKSGTIVLSLGATTIGGKTGVTLKRGQITEDSTTLDSAAEENEGVLPNWSADIDGFVVSGDAGRTALVAAVKSGAKVDVTYVCDGVTETGKATVTDVTDTSQVKKLVVQKVSLQGSGALTTA